MKIMKRYVFLNSDDLSLLVHLEHIVAVQYTTMIICFKIQTHTKYLFIFDRIINHTYHVYDLIWQMVINVGTLQRYSFVSNYYIKRNNAPRRCKRWRKLKIIRCGSPKVNFYYNVILVHYRKKYNVYYSSLL